MVNFTLYEFYLNEKKKQGKKSDAWPFTGVAETLKKGFIKTKNL